MDHPLWSKMVHLLVGPALTGCLGDQRQVDIQQSSAIGDLCSTYAISESCEDAVALIDLHVDLH